MRVSQATARPHIRQAMIDVLRVFEFGSDEPSAKKRRRRHDIKEIRELVIDIATDFIVAEAGKNETISALGDFIILNMF